MIPEIDPETGHLPPGRYRCTLEEFEERFVGHPAYLESASRPRIFDGFVRYLADWEATSERTRSDGSLLHGVWVAGSFVSSKVEPGDIDVSPIVDGPLADSVAGRPGSKMIRELTKHRASIKAQYEVEVFPVRWYPIARPFRAGLDLIGDELAYLSDRGKMDDWWQRCRVDGDDEPSVESCVSRRGYVEVMI